MWTGSKSREVLGLAGIEAASHEVCFFIDGLDHFIATRKPGIARTSGHAP